MVGILGHRVSARPQEEQVGNQPYHIMKSQQKLLDTKAQVSLFSCQYSMCTGAYHCQEELTLSTTPLGEDKWKLSI